MVINNLKMVKNEKKYWKFILKIRNENKKFFQNTKKIKYQEHCNFMKNNGEKYKICLLKNKPVGFIGCINGDIRICVDKKNQKMGIGKFMMEKFLNKKRKYKTLIRCENIASLKLFEKFGFSHKYIILEN